ncbi:MAG: hypothetical protein ABEK36_06225 [Candidatus Aenigmatarchaeota archaeon]
MPLIKGKKLKKKATVQKYDDDIVLPHTFNKKEVKTTDMPNKLTRNGWYNVTSKPLAKKEGRPGKPHKDSKYKTQKKDIYVWW